MILKIKEIIKINCGEKLNNSRDRNNEKNEIKVETIKYQR
jgi:hypothetical protein